MSRPLSREGKCQASNLTLPPPPRPSCCRGAGSVNLGTPSPNPSGKQMSPTESVGDQQGGCHRAGGPELASPQGLKWGAYLPALLWSQTRLGNPNKAAWLWPLAQRLLCTCGGGWKKLWLRNNK